MLQIGIYKICNTVSGNCYVGSSQDIKSRWQNHISALRNHRHDNQIIQRAFDKYGEEAFVFEILENCAVDQLLIREQHYIDTLRPTYNIALYADAGMRGRKHTEESRQLMSAAIRGRKLTETHKARIAAAHLGKVQQPHTEEQKRKIAEGNRGKKHSLESIEKMRVAQSGKIISVEQRQKISEMKSKPVKRIDPLTGDIKTYSSITAASLDGFVLSNVARCCKGERKMHRGYKWEFIQQDTVVQ